MYFPLSIERTLMLERHQCLNTTSSNVHFREVVVVDSRGKIKIIFHHLLWSSAHTVRLTI